MDNSLLSISMNDVLIELILGLYSVGLVLLAAWWLDWRYPIRRTRLPLFFPIFQILVWLSAALMANEIIKRLFHDKPESTLLFAQNAASAIIQMILGISLLCFAQVSFIRGLKGIGLCWKTLKTDLWKGALTLAAVYPVILFALQTTVLIGILFVGKDFSLEQHQSLAELTQTSSFAMKILLIVSAAFIAPLFEELLFRGLLQTTLTAYLQKPLLAVVITSTIFSLLHPSTHFAGIFVLSFGMGLAYEKSGSLFRSIWMHILFNSISLVGTLLGI